MAGLVPTIHAFPSVNIARLAAVMTGVGVNAILTDSVTATTASAGPSRPSIATSGNLFQYSI